MKEVKYFFAALQKCKRRHSRTRSGISAAKKSHLRALATVAPFIENRNLVPRPQGALECGGMTPL
jgi:hypothetical protein